MFGKIKEYNIFEITKKVIEKEKWSFSEFDKKIVTEIEEALVDGGFVFGIGKKENKVKIAKGIYIFKLTKNEDEKVLVFDRCVFSEKIRDEVIEKYIENLDSILGTLVSEQHVNRAVFEEKEFEHKKVKIGKKEVSVMVFWILWGLITSILTKDIIWLCLGLCFGTSSSYTIKVNGSVVKKQNKKAKSKEKN